MTYPVRPQRPQPFVPANIKREYWFLGFLHENRPVVWILPDVHDVAAANRKGEDKLQGKHFVAFSMGTKDLTKANEQARALLLEENADADVVLRRAKHTDIETKPDVKQI